MSRARRIYAFPGGLRLTENKTQSLSSPLIDAEIPEILIFPISQHLGAPAIILVEVGQRVLKGEMIAKADGYVSASVHASTSGIVTAINQHAISSPSGIPDTCILLEPDDKDEWIELQGIADYTSVDKSVLLEKIHAAGVIGMGGAGFPAAVKLNLPPDSVIDTLILNGTECEPYVTADDMLMRTDADTIVKGALLLAYILDEPQEILIGIEDNKPEAIAELKRAAADTAIEIIVFPPKYPSGGENQLIQILTGREVPSGGMPADLGIVVQNLGTAVAAYQAVTKGEPLISRIVTVTGKAVQQPANYRTLVGTPYSHLLTLSKFNEAQATRVICGGPMMGFTVDTLETPVIKSTSCILVPTRDELPNELPEEVPAQACIRCGHCAEACPVSLLPQQLYWHSQAQDYDKLTTHNLLDCIECGCCSFVCPSSIPLVQYFRASKGEMKQREQDQIKADRFRMRFEAKQQRLEREEAEKIAKKAARKEAAIAMSSSATSSAPKADDNTADDPIKAAMARVAAQKALADKSPEDQKLKLAQLVDEARDSVEKTLEKLQDAETNGVENLDKLRAAIANAKVKLADAEKKLAEFLARAVNTTLNTTLVETSLELIETEKTVVLIQSNPNADANSLESVESTQIAIQQAKEKAAAAANMGPNEKVLSRVTAIEERIAKTLEKLSKAQEEKSAQVETLSHSLQKLEIKLAAAKQEFARVKQGPTSKH